MTKSTLNLKTTFAAKNTTMDVVARSMKKSGIAVFIRTKAGSAKAVLGCRSIVTTEEEAMAAYNALDEGVKAKGWQERVGRAGSAGRFTEIPDVPTTDVVDEAPKAPKKVKK